MKVLVDFQYIGALAYVKNQGEGCARALGIANVHGQYSICTWRCIGLTFCQDSCTCCKALLHVSLFYVGSFTPLGQRREQLAVAPGEHRGDAGVHRHGSRRGGVRLAIQTQLFGRLPADESAACDECLQRNHVSDCSMAASGCQAEDPARFSK